MKYASSFGSFIGGSFGPFFRSKKKITLNIKKALPEISEKNIKIIAKEMWKNYGRILSEYVFIKDFRDSINEKIYYCRRPRILR